jgi:DNA-directed RNA polymerase subunit RPC12/RpoP
MVKDFENWLFDESRKEGDTGIVTTTYGDHVMYFVGTDNAVWYNNVFETIYNEDYKEWFEDAKTEAGVSINSIGQLFSEEHPEKVIDILLDQQEQTLRQEISQSQKKLDMVQAIRRQLKEIDHFSVESIGDIAHIMENKTQLRKMRWLMVLTGIPVTVLQWVAIILGITRGLWWLLGIWACVAIPWGICISIYYHKHVSYICPECHEIFRPGFKEMFWAYHTPKMRRLTCPKCGHKGMCVEVYAQQEGNHD